MATINEIVQNNIKINIEKKMNEEFFRIFGVEKNTTPGGIGFNGVINHIRNQQSFNYGSFPRAYKSKKKSPNHSDVVRIGNYIEMYNENPTRDTWMCIKHLMLEHRNDFYLSEKSGVLRLETR